MKILNLYSGIGGNRKLWGDSHEIIAVENNPQIAKIYQDFFPKDKMVIADAPEKPLEICARPMEGRRNSLIIIFSLLFPPPFLCRDIFQDL